ncbi:MAG: hypothetical protein CVU49_00165 [Candidatus Cloacimonetes bacterium HGW-Cloacimonetes-2]|nr:MAG: hypothetical protein CVU49_00165 [Candidatus Cloacimonetes bacterium HGW-Cloacimonetes-2]
MPIFIRVLLAIFSVSFFVGFVLLVRNKSVKPIYSFLWLMVALGMLSIVVFEKFYKSIATLLGITDASFMVIVGLISFLLVYVFYISIKLSEMSDKIQELISFSSMLEHDIRVYREKHEAD